MDDKNMANMAGGVSSESKLMGALSYIWIVSIIMLLLKKDDQFVQFHARQGLVIFVASWLWFIPFLGWIVALLAFICAIVGFIKAYSGEKFPIPGVSMIAEKIKI